MMTLVVGGAASGKSEYAESLLMRLDGRRYYIATMQPFGEEALARIRKHRAMRALKRFETIECSTNLLSVHLPERGNVLLECMSNLAANELYAPEGAGEAAYDAILTGVDVLRRQCDALVIVSNEVFTGGNQYAGDTDHYLHLLAKVNRALAGRADNVCEVICGQAYYYKGREGAV
ncbi:MAG: bifunctional adenosylcobinamide kinase/adenosylcobinamide-phosphate guanylyltransferase [Eubacteriales bacterium]|nr:bifunctional adenosylcobinamide kinase/adenosylcobinamide-phosphate guanylyltransferase [Eubacteriales bacterium]